MIQHKYKKILSPDLLCRYPIGWDALIDEILEKLDEASEGAIIVSCIKEKYGSLRIHHNLNDSVKINNIVKKYTIKSSHTCSVSGYYHDERVCIVTENKRLIALSKEQRRARGITEDLYKQVIIIRNDLKMRKGKMISQGAHGVEWVSHEIGDIERNIWKQNAHAKITVQCNNELELFKLTYEAKKSCLPYSLVKDHGRTEFNGVHTYTALVIGPAPSSIINKITGGLKLL
jgi:PTH2 family peptidyl-tRNA hydrolase